MSVWYLDSSEVVKFAVDEPETAAITDWRAGLTDDDVLITCELALAEVLRAVRRVDGDSDVAMANVDALDQLVVDRELLCRRRNSRSLGLRTLAPGR